MAELVIRKMRLEDVPQVACLEKEAFSRPWSAQALKESLVRPEYVFLTAVEQEKVIGYCGAQAVLGEAVITNIAVFQARRGEGAGAKLLDALVEKLKERGVLLIHLEVRAGNHRAIGLYRSRGFREAGLRKNFYSCPKEDGVLMTLKIHL